MGTSKQISYNTLGNIATLFFQWLIIMLIPKMTNFAEAGVFAVAVSVSSIMNQIATFTLNQYQVVDNYEKYSENDYAMTRIVTILLSFICIIPISILFNYDANQIWIIVSYTLYRNFINFAYLYASSLQIVNRLDYVGKCMMIEGIVSFLVFIASYVAIGSLLVSTLLMALCGGLFFLFSLDYGHRKILGRKYEFKPEINNNVKLLLIVGSSLLLSMMCPIIITALPKLILESYWGDEIVGIFSTLTAPTIVIPTIASSMFAPFIVYFAEICKKNDIAKLRRQYAKIVGVLIVFGAVCYLVSVLLSGFIFEMIYGSEIVQYTHYFDLLIIGIVLYSIGTCSITVLITKEQGKYAGLASLAALLISIVIFMAMIPDGGMDGATWSLLLAYGVFGLLTALCVFIIPLKKNSDENNG